MYTYDALPLGLMSKGARRQILGVRWKNIGPRYRSHAAGMAPEKLSCSSVILALLRVKFHFGLLHLLNIFFGPASTL
jgi:hypothetical protein